MNRYYGDSWVEIPLVCQPWTCGWAAAKLPSLLLVVYSQPVSRQQLQYAQSGKAVNQNSFGNVTFHTVCKYSDTIEYPYNAVFWVHDIVARLVIGTISEGVDSLRLVGDTTMRENTRISDKFQLEPH